MSKKNEVRARVNMRWPKDVTEWLKKQAKKKNTTMTQLCVDHWTREMEKARDALK